jgi:hypothetical protein
MEQTVQNILQEFTITLLRDSLKGIHSNIEGSKEDLVLRISNDISEIGIEEVVSQLLPETVGALCEKLGCNASEIEEGGLFFLETQAKAETTQVLLTKLEEDLLHRLCRGHTF